MRLINRCRIINQSNRNSEISKNRLLIYLFFNYSSILERILIFLRALELNK